MMQLLNWFDTNYSTINAAMILFWIVVIPIIALATKALQIAARFVCVISDGVRSFRDLAQSIEHYLRFQENETREARGYQFDYSSDAPEEEEEDPNADNRSDEYAR